LGVFDYEASAEEYRRRQAELAARRRAGDEDGDEPDGVVEQTAAADPVRDEREERQEREEREERSQARRAPAGRRPLEHQPPGGLSRRRGPTGRPAPPRPPAPAPERAPGTALPAGLNEREAAALLDQLSERFGWSVAAIGRATIERALGRQLSQEEWQRVRGSRWWTGGVPDAMRAGGTELLPTMLSSLGIEAEPDDDG
jgi:hypothetical protein